MHDTTARIKPTEHVTTDAECHPPDGDTVLSLRILGTKVNNMASRLKGLVCLWHHEHGRTYRSHDFSGGGRSRVLVS